MTVVESISKVDFLSLVQDVENQNKVFPDYSPMKIAVEFFSEQHQMAVVFNRFHTTMKEKGLSEWRKKGYMEDDFDILFEYVERGYSQKIKGFDIILKILDAISRLGSPDNFSYDTKQILNCKVCEGSGFDEELDEDCKRCEGQGKVVRNFSAQGNTEEEYLKVISDIGSLYNVYTEENYIASFNTFFERYNEEDVDIRKHIEIRHYNEYNKPTCKFIGEDGNVFNLMAIAYRALKRNGLKEKGDEMQERVWKCDSYAEALMVMGYYVNIV